MGIGEAAAIPSIQARVTRNAVRRFVRSGLPHARALARKDALACVRVAHSLLVDGCVWHLCLRECASCLSACARESFAYANGGFACPVSSETPRTEGGGLSPGWTAASSWFVTAHPSNQQPTQRPVPAKTSTKYSWLELACYCSLPWCFPYSLSPPFPAHCPSLSFCA
eukprot:3918827-Pleurochrysis_carterae.AAC.1